LKAKDSFPAGKPSSTLNKIDITIFSWG